MQQKIKAIIRSRKGVAILAGAVVLIGILVILLVNRGKQEEVVYRETTAAFGELTVGLTENGNVTVGTANETFDLDLSAFTGGSTDGFSWGQGGGGDIFQGMGSMMGGVAPGGSAPGGSPSSSASSSSRALEIEEVLVSEGQEIEAGTPIYTLSAESVDSIRQELELDVSDAEVALAQTQTQQKMTQLEAEQTRQLAVSYGSLAQIEYSSSLKALQDAVDEINEQMLDLTEEINDLNVDLTEYMVWLAEEQTVLANAEYIVSISDMLTDANGWITAENAREEAASVVETLETSIETTTESIADKTTELAELQESLTGAMRDLELGTIDANAQLSLRKQQSDTAEEQYQVNVEKSGFDVQTAQEEYDNAKAKLDEFNAVLDGQTLTSANRGVVTNVSLAKGDAVNTGTVLLVINDYDEVTVAVTVEETDLENIAEKDRVNVFIASWPDEEFIGTVREIGESTYNSSTGTSYAEVTIQIDGAVEKLYDGMSAEITFITKETEQVLHVSNRAVFRENGKSYVKVKNADGQLETKEVMTGFSDGTEVEITKGLSEGDTVLIESKVSD